MYKVLLVDDEILIRNKISQRMPWEELGYHLAGTCENGQEAISFIEKEPVDLILTDICMPYVDGLELARYVYEFARKTKVVIITGYDEFDYAKKALEYHAFSYVLKPITVAELVNSLKEVKTVLDEESESLQMRTYYEDSYTVLKNQFLIDLMMGKIEAAVLAEKQKEFQLDFSGGSYCAAVLYSHSGLDKQERNDLLKVFHNEFSKDVRIFLGIEEDFVVFLKKENSVQVKKEIVLVCMRMMELVKEVEGRESFFLLGVCVSRLSDINISFEKAMEVKEYAYLEIEFNLYQWEGYQKARMEGDRRFEQNEREKRFVLAVQSNLLEDIKHDMDLISQECREKWIEKNRVIVLYQSMILAVMNSLESLNIADDSLFRKEQEVLSGLFECRFLSQMEERVLDFFTTAMETMNRNRGTYGKQQAALAMEYLAEYFFDSNLTLQVMCEKLAISVSYFSSAFKSYTGMTFVEALTKKRMEKALELLHNTSMKTYEIAEKCGYTDPNYFSATFKKMMGMTPREYVKSIKSPGK